MDAKVKKSREKKERIVAEISEKVGKAKALVFTNYQGMTHKQLEELKKALKNVQAELVVTKNTLLKRALEMENKQSLSLRDGKWKMENFNQPTATLFSYADPIVALKELAKSIKTLKLPVIKLGIFEGKLLAEADVLRLSTLPSREVLLAQLVGGMKVPLYGLHRVLSWNIQKFAMTLKAIENKKS